MRKSKMVGKKVSMDFFDVCEAERVARIVEMWNPSNPDLVGWRDDLVVRMRRQIDAIIHGENA